MEGSSGGWRKPVSSRGLDTSNLSEPNLRLLHESRISLSTDASQNSIFGPGRRSRDSLGRGPSDHIRNRLGSFGVPEDEDVVAMDPSVRGIEWGDVSLRQWLDNPERTVDEVESLHIFRQITEIVSTAHSQGIVLNNIRPSCFVMSSFNHVSFIESASGSDSGSDSLEDGLNSQNMEGKQDYLETHLASLDGGDGCERKDNSSLEQARENQSFPMKELLQMETSWYTSPEEIAGAPCSCASDIYRLGVLLFELFCSFNSTEEKSRTMCSLRHRVLPPQILLKWPKEASFCLWLLHPDPSSRPKMCELLQSEFFNEPRDDIDEREAAVELREKIEEEELLLEFLILMRQAKQEAANKLNSTVSFLTSDINEIANKQRSLKQKSEFSLRPDKYQHPTSDLPQTNMIEHKTCGLQSFQSVDKVKSGSNQNESGKVDMVIDKEDSLITKNSRLMKNFKKLESAYLTTRQRPMRVSSKPVVSHSQRSSINQGSVVLSEKSTISKDHSSNDGDSGWVNPFLDGLCKYLSYTKLTEKANLKQADLLNSSNLVCSVSFDRDGEFFATAGVNKKIKIYECDPILSGDRDIHYPVVEMVSKSKLSSACWNSYIKSQIASSNFDGLVQVWDAARSQVFMELKEHERRVWSVDFSTADPTILASGSDDGSVKLWSINQGTSIGTIKTKANVCCVQFPSNSGRCLAFGSADHRIYYYDLRNPRVPLCSLIGHNKTVSYIKYVDSTTLVSGSTDNSLKLWDLSMCGSRAVEGPIQSFTGHTNVKNFVGLSVSDGFIATGSETNEVFVYHKAFSMPAVSFKFNSVDPFSGNEIDDPAQFISSVCWRNGTSTLVAANSSGDIKVLEMV